ncbi:MAG: energy-coupling factor ABC transporter permease [Chloroflexi bacterium]|nr:energy-coupling factor ABC transporter permease [Chloroflexota bacterium]
MTHMMVPDGVLPPWLWIGGWLLAIAALTLALWSTRSGDSLRLIPLAGTMAAVMTIVMSLEIVPLGYEPHLTVLAGIVLGPAYGLLATFVFNLLRMLLGDGSITLLGLNTVVLGVETVGGYLAFRALRSLHRTPSGGGVAAAAASILALAAATFTFLGIVWLSSVDVSLLAEEDFLEQAGADAPGFGIYANLVLVLGAIGWVLEAVVVGTVVAFLCRVRPSLLPAAVTSRP